MSEITGEKINGKKFRIFPGQSDPLKEHSFFSRTLMPTGTVYDEYDTVDEVVTEIVDNGKFDIPALPAVGTPIVIGELYTDDGNVYRVRQSHNVTAYDPDDIPALFTIYRKETADMEWVIGEQVDVGVQRTYEGKTYEVMQAHQTQLVWTPEATLGVLWKLYIEPEPGVQEWAAGVSYTVGDLVTYEEITYSCRQSHTSIPSWTPPAVLALWLPQ